MTKDFLEKSYEKHALHFEQTMDDKKHESWFKSDTVDSWRTRRMYDTIDLFVKNTAGSSWLTLGDGRYGLDSIKLKAIEPTISVLPTDISEHLLKIAKAKNIISGYSIENAEGLSFADEQFDYTFCKESYHHFPRPYKALYEMVRVARKGVVLIEPNDPLDVSFFGTALTSLKNMIKHILGKKVYHTDKWLYETSGNYIYSISAREMEKVCLGMNLPCIAYKYFNDYYEVGLEFAPMLNNSKIFKKVKRKIFLKNILSSVGLRSFENVTLIILKQIPDADLVKKLNAEGFRVVELPNNPYI